MDAKETIELAEKASEATIGAVKAIKDTLSTATCEHSSACTHKIEEKISTSRSIAGPLNRTHLALGILAAGTILVVMFMFMRVQVLTSPVLADKEIRLEKLRALDKVFGKEGEQR